MNCRKRILVVFGTRPEAIKMAPVVKALGAWPDVDARLCVTGQHQEMLEQVMTLFALEPNYSFCVMKPGQSLNELTSSILIQMEPILREFQPDIVLVHGDTTTTLAVSLAAYYMKIAVGHVEAGLRTGDIYAPWPEELNRKLVSGIAKLHFAPTKTSAQNLYAEGVDPKSVVVTGNTIVDALFLALEQLDNNVSLKARIDSNITSVEDGKRLILVTGHRRENFGEGFENIFTAIRQIATNYPDVLVVYPVHLNPQVRDPVNRLLSDVKNVVLIEPVGYFEFVQLMRKAYFILTDSGGIQEEAPSLGVPVLVMRNTTERPEAVKAGTVKIVGTECSTIVAASSVLLDDPIQHEAMSAAHNPYGDGNATARIKNKLADFLQ